MKKILFSIGICLLTSSVHAGFNGLTVHSRANCINNESIAWDWTTYRDLWTDSDHYVAATGEWVHGISTGWQHTWRNAAVHYGEGTKGWKVLGRHWTRTDSGIAFSIGEEWVVDCSIYDGWWDRNK